MDQGEYQPYPWHDGHVQTRMRRAGGDVLCECGREYWRHPQETSLVDRDGNPYLRKVCDGSLVKL